LNFTCRENGSLALVLDGYERAASHNSSVVGNLPRILLLWFRSKGFGQLGQAVSFQFYRLHREDIPQAFNINFVLVERKISGSHWKRIWAVMGRERLREISYGRYYSGLNEIVPAQPLIRGAKYRVSIATDDGGYGGEYFKINDVGGVVAARPMREDF
jgi:hypothetical protein